MIVFMILLPEKQRYSIEIEGTDLRAVDALVALWAHDVTAVPVLDQAAFRALFRFDIGPFQLHVLMGVVFRNLDEDAGIMLGTDTHVTNLSNLLISFDSLHVDTKRQLDQLRAIVSVLIANFCLRHLVCPFTMVVNGKSRFTFSCLRAIADPPFGDAHIPIRWCLYICPLRLSDAGASTGLQASIEVVNMALQSQQGLRKPRD